MKRRKKKKKRNSPQFCFRNGNAMQRKWHGLGLDRL